MKYIAWLRLGLLVWSLVAGGGAALAFERSLERADISVTLDNGQPPVALGQQTLPWKWDTSFPRQRGIAHLTVEFDYSAKLKSGLENDAGNLGLYADHLGNRYRYRLNNNNWHLVGWDKSTTQYRTKPRWHTLLANELQIGSNTLELELRMEPASDAGLSTIELTDVSTAGLRHQNAMNIRQGGALLVLYSSLIFGVLCLAMWRVTRERLFGFAGLAEVVFGLRQVALFIDYPPLPTWLWNSWFGALGAIYIGLLWKISYELIPQKSRVLMRLTTAFLYLCVPFLMVGTALGDYRYFYYCSLVVLIFSVFIALRVSWYGVRNNDLNLRLFMLATWVAVVIGMYDFVAIQAQASGLGKVRLGTYTTFLFNLSLTVLLVRKFIAGKQEVLEAKLKIKFEREHATMAERQRIMSDIHDTVGSQLVGVLGMIRSGASRDQLENETSLALEDLRSAIDAIQPINGNLAAVLATLRLRLEPRLQAHGLKLVWQLDDLPRMANMTPQVIQHIQRIVLEALNNIIKHAKATTVTFSARVADNPPAVLVNICDDGVGFDAAALGHQGHGLSNMRLRADAIGATVSFKNAAEKGACVSIALPAAPSAA